MSASSEQIEVIRASPDGMDDPEILPNAVCAIANLRFLQGRLAAGDERERDLAARIGAYFDHAHRGLTLDEAFGVEGRRGHARWWKVEDQRQCNELLRQLADLVLTEQSAAKRARQLQKELQKYATTANGWLCDKKQIVKIKDWPAPRALAFCPPRHEGWRDKYLLFQIFRLCDGRVPMGLSTLRDILARRLNPAGKIPPFRRQARLSDSELQD